MKRGGSVIPAKLRTEMNEDPEYTRCCLQGYHECAGRITREHALYYAGKKVQDRFAIIPLCAQGHGVDLFQDAGTVSKEVRVWVALNRATDQELFSISKVVNYLREKDRLNEKYGTYAPPPIPQGPVAIIPPPFSRTRRTEPLDEVEKEARRYARANGIPVGEAMDFLVALN